MNAFNSADVFPKRVGVPNMTPSAHSTLACVGAPYSASIRLLRSSQPGTLAITFDETRSGTAKSDFGSGFSGSFTDSFSKRFHGAVTRVKRNENVWFRLWHS